MYNLKVVLLGVFFLIEADKKNFKCDFVLKTFKNDNFFYQSRHKRASIRVYNEKEKKMKGVNDRTV